MCVNVTWVKTERLKTKAGSLRTLSSAWLYELEISMPIKTLIMGAAGRDFHNFNTFFRGNKDYEVVAFTATQIPDIEGRLYPPELAGELVRGIALRVSNPNVFDPYKAGVSILWAVNKLHADKLVWNDAVLERCARPGLRAPRGTGDHGAGA